MALDNELPIEGNWYEIPESGKTFLVLTVDEDDEVAEIQYEDGTVEEIDLADWEDLGAENIEEPEDWVGAYEEMDDEDYELGEPEEEDAWDEPYDE